jgi:hypothetical protein
MHVFDGLLRRDFTLSVATKYALFFNQRRNIHVSQETDIFRTMKRHATHVA